MVFVAMIHEGGAPWAPASMFGGTRRHIDSVMGELLQAEVCHGIDPRRNAPTHSRHARLVRRDLEEDLEEELAVNPGDVCRVFRMAIQLMRNVRRSIDRDWDIVDHLDDAIET